MSAYVVVEANVRDIEPRDGRDKLDGPLSLGRLDVIRPEADFGRTFVVGSDPRKSKLRDDVGKAFAAGKQYFNDHPAITGSELFRYACDLAARYGWEFGGPIAGHLIGNFPHEKIAGDKISLYIHPQNVLPMRSFDTYGHQRHWILEMHFVDRKRQIGAFYEELLTL